MRLFAPRYLPLIVSAGILTLSLYQSLQGEGQGWWLVAVSGALTLVGTADMIQNRNCHPPVRPRFQAPCHGP